MCLERFKCNANDFLWRFVTGDEIWVYCYTPNTKQQALKEAKTDPSAKMVLVTVSWDSREIIMIDYLKNGKTITASSILVYKISKRCNQEETSALGQEKNSASFRQRAGSNVCSRDREITRIKLHLTSASTRSSEP